MISHPNLIGKYPLNYDATDKSQNAENGTLVGSPTFTSGVIGNALTLNGTSQRVDFGDVKDMGTDNFTLCVRVKTSSVDTMQIINKYGVTTYGWDMYISSGKIHARLSTSSGQKTIRSNSVINDGNFHHICSVFQRGTFPPNIYIDGILHTNTTILANTGNLSANADNVSPLYFGARSDPASYQYFIGSIQDAQIYKGIALPASDIKRIMLGKHPLTRS